MVQTLEFAVVGRYCGIEPVVDGTRLAELLGKPWMGSIDWSRGDPGWAITARALQGWVPRDLGLERQTHVVTGPPIAGCIYPIDLTATVRATLPGGSRREVDADDLEEFVAWDDGIPIIASDCGVGDDCELVAVTFTRSKVHWQHAVFDFVFDRAAYNRAIQRLLVLVGEAPILISDEEWTQPTPTRVVENDPS